MRLRARNPKEIGSASRDQLLGSLHKKLAFSLIVVLLSCDKVCAFSSTTLGVRSIAQIPKDNRFFQSKYEKRRDFSRNFFPGTSSPTALSGVEDKGGTNEPGRFSIVKESCRKVLQKTRAAFHSLVLYQRRKGRGIIFGVAFALSVFFTSRDKLSANMAANNLHFNSHMQQPAKELVMNRKQSPAVNHESLLSGLRVVGGGGKAIFEREMAAAEESVIVASTATSKTIKTALSDLGKYMQGPKSDTLLLLLATALITPICQGLGTSPILGFLASGMLLGPNGFGLISGIHTTETLAELGIVFFLFEMGIELSIERLMSMRKDVFGLGLSQFTLTAAVIALVGSLFGLPANALVVLGGGLALSSSAFVLQLLKDKNQLATRFGKAAFGVLLFQDLAVVPLLVVTPILAGQGTSLASALGSAVVKASLALSSIAFAGRTLLNPLFKAVATTKSQEAFLGTILLTVLSMSFMTEGLGLSNTLGAFLAGVLLSETKYRYQIEADIAPFRGVLLGLFFVTVGFEIDVGLIASNFPAVSAIVLGTLAVKGLVLTGLSMLFGLSLSTSQQTGLILSQGGEFAFVAFGLARSLGILSPKLTKLMLTSVSLTMAATPFLAELGSRIAKKLEEESDFSHYLGQDRDASEIKEGNDFAVVVGYGNVGKVVCELLDQKFYKYVGLEVDPNKAIQARNKGLPVFYGDIARPEVAEAFNVGKAKAVIVTIADRQECTRAVISLRRMYPETLIFARAYDADHAERLQKTLDVVAMVPVLPEDNFLMTLPFGGAVLKSLGSPVEEVNAILEAKRKEILLGKGLVENEEEVALIQMGIAPAEKTKPKKDVVTVEVEEDVNEESVGETERSPTEAAAAAIVEQLEKKSPMVAMAIEANCPGAAECEEDEEDVDAIEAEAEESEMDVSSGPAALAG